MATQTRITKSLPQSLYPVYNHFITYFDIRKDNIHEQKNM